MTGRTLAMTLAAWGCGLATTCWAQGYAAGDVVTLPPEAGGFSYSSGAFGDAGPGYGGMAPAGYGAPAEYCPPGAPYGAVPCDPQPACWWKCRPLLISPRLLKPARGSFVRLEYLLWEIEEPGNVLLGIEPPEELDDLFDQDFDDTADFNNPNTIFDDNFDPEDGFFTFDPFTGFNFSYTPRLEELQLRDNSGLRLTFGIPTYDYGTIELSGWLLEQASDRYSFGQREIFPPFYGFINLDMDAEAETGAPFPGTLFNPSNLTTINGENTGFFGRAYERLDVTYQSDLWGADAKFVVDSLSPQGEGLKLKPLFGFKYIGLQEALYQRGFVQPLLASSVSSTIDSTTSNTIMGGTIGLRTELVHRWFVLGLQPAVTFAGNVSQARVVTERVGSNADPYREVESDYFDFCPVLDLNAYARICLSENLRLTVGYDAFWLSRVYRPARTIDYAMTSDAFGNLRSDFDTKREDEHIAVEGLSVGLEFIF